MAITTYRYDDPATPLAPLTGSIGSEHRRRIAEAANQALRGKLNAQRDVTLTANATATVIVDPRITPNSFIGLMPTTANAAAEIGAGTMYVSARGDQTATITHANNAQTDRTYRVTILG